jgi:dihydroflavonol-4-reductase
MRIYLTGGTGYVGQTLAPRLVAMGHEVRALVRPTSDARALHRLGISTFLGDVEDRESMREGMSGSRWVIHAGAALPSTPPERMLRVNVIGSENVASLAHELGVERFLSVSSIAYFGGSPPDGSAADEEAPMQTPFPTVYSETKHAGELAIRRWAERGLRVNTVYPSIVYGPPSGRHGANKLLRGFLERRIPVLAGGDRKLSWIYLDDLVEGIVRVFERAPPGRAYLMAGEVATIRETVERVCSLGRVRAPRVELPGAMLRMAAALARPVFWLHRRRPPFSGGELDGLRRHWAFDDRRARRELDWYPRGLAAGLPPTIEHLRSGDDHLTMVKTEG